MLQIAPRFHFKPRYGNLHGLPAETHLNESDPIRGQIERLFFVKRIEVGGNSTGINTEGAQGDNAVKVFVTPYDQYDSTLKAAGELTIQLYDLSLPPERNLIGQCIIGVDKIHDYWTNGLFAQYYIVPCAWKTSPKQDSVTVRVVFTDYLTGRSFTDQRVVKVQLPAQTATAPASAPATQSTQPAK